MKTSLHLVRSIAKVALPVILSALSAHAQTSLSFDFDSGFTLGSIIGQQGWSAGAAPGLLVDPNDGTTVTQEAVTNAAAYSGTQSWLYSHGISSGYQFSAGTPFSPNLGLSLSRVGDTMSGRLYFKAATLGDGSWLELDAGNPAGNDRSEIIGYLHNDAGNLSFSLIGATTSPDGYVDITVADHLDAGWHQLDFQILRAGVDANAVSATVDGLSASAAGALAFYRDSSSFDYEDSSRLKFAGSVSGDGFYLDDISYSITSVPEPSTYASWAAAAVLALALIRTWRNRPALLRKSA